MRTLRFLVPRQGFEDLHRPFGQFSAIWPAILCATVVVRRAISKQRLPTGLWTLSRLLIRARVRNAPFTLGSTQQGLSPSVRGWEVCLFRIYALQPAGLLRIPLPGFTSWTVSPWPPKCCRWVTDSRLCYLYSCVFAASHSNYSVQPFMLLLSALYSVQLQLYNVYSIGVPSCFVFTAA